MDHLAWPCCSQQGQLKRIVQDHVQSGFSYVHEWRLCNHSVHGGLSSNRFKNKQTNTLSHIFSRLCSPVLSAYPHIWFPNSLTATVALCWTCSSTSMSLLLGSSEPHPALQVSHQSWTEGHLLWPAGYILPNAAQAAAVVICCKGTLLAHIQVVHWVLCRAAFQAVSPQSVLVHGAFLLRCRRLWWTEQYMWFKTPK